MEMPSHEALPSGMDATTAAQVADSIRAAGFHADVASVDWGASPVDPRAPLCVKAELNAGWDTLFSAEAWETHPDNPNRTEPANW